MILVTEITFRYGTLYVPYGRYGTLEALGVLIEAIYSIYCSVFLF